MACFMHNIVQKKKKILMHELITDPLVKEYVWAF